MTIPLPPELEGRTTLSIAETAKFLEISKDRAYVEARKGTIKTLPLGGVKRVPVSWVIAMLESGEAA